MNPFDEPQAERLMEALLTLRTPEECRLFLEDLLTIQEIKVLGHRFAVAAMLDENHTYGEICEATGASITTVGRVKRSYDYGGGYRLVLERLKQKGGNNP